MLLFVYAFIYSFFTAFAYTIMFILGGSTGGSDYITVYFSQIKNKSLGNMFIIINSFCLIVGVSLGSYTSGAIIDPAHYSGYQYFFSANLFMSLV